MSPLRDPELGWGRFLRGLYGLLLASLAFLGIVLIVLLLQSTRLTTKETIAAEGGALARSTARGAFVPLVLENEARLQALVEPLRREPHLVEVRLFDAAGRLRARGAGRGAGDRDPAPRRYAAPILNPATGEATGRVEVSMSDLSLRRRLYERAAWGAGFVVLLMAAVYLLAARMAKTMTGRFRALLDEAMLAERLRRSNSDLEQFAAVASHDLKEPLRKITTFSQLIATLTPEERERNLDDYLRRMADAASRMQLLVDDLLEYSRIGHVQEKPGWVDLGAVVSEAISNLQEAIDQSGATVRVGRLPRVMAHRVPMVRLAQNLIANAIKFRGAEPPVVEIAARRGPGTRGFSVSDNGIGIDPKYHEKIFGVFSRLHSRAEYQGSGIGLAACRRIVETHGGDIRVESKPGKGTRFTVSLPEREG